MIDCYVGVDPGKMGGIAWLTARFSRAEGLSKMTDRDILDMFVEIKRDWPLCVAMLERVHAMPRQGVASTFKFGRIFGVLQMGLLAAEIPFREVPPHVWQRSLGCLSRGDKNVTKRMAQQIFPSQKVTHAKADALLLAEYCRRKWNSL